MGRNPPDAADPFTTEDLERLARRGVSAREARRQLALLRRDPPPRARLERPATAGDGILRLPEERHGDLLALADAAARAGRLGRFVPASGAATRMFRDLLGEAPPALATFLENLPRFPFADQLDGLEKDPHRLLDHLLTPAGLNYPRRPKGLIPFHRHPGGPRTPFAEHLAEAALHLADGDGRCRLHFTVAGEHEGSFREHLEAARRDLEELHGARFEVTFSTQSPATDTLAAELDGRPARRPDGTLLLRPGGHGALLPNLHRAAVDLGFDLAQIKNIDNVVPDAGKALVTRWKRLLIGLLVDLERRAADHLERLRGDDAGGGAAAAALAFLERELRVLPPPELAGAPPDQRRAYARQRLARPLRVCGMVENRGEPGGGPFWTRSPSGDLTPQIVESAQIDLADPAQRALVAAATHFNPVDLVCALRDADGRPHDLPAFVDPNTAFVTTKTESGRPIKALEHPGLWNGAMAGWNTVMVEVPAATFAPVKTVLDLLRPEHQAC